MCSYAIVLNFSVRVSQSGLEMVEISLKIWYDDFINHRDYVYRK